jgi:plasmid stabilization system protein ParE
VRLEIKEIVFDDLKFIKEYYRLCFAEEAFDKLESHFDKAVKDLLRFPQKGARLKIPQYEHYRYLLLDTYYLLYTDTNDKLTIQRVIHTARNLSSILRIK